jgi:hypothetical protein
MGTLSFDNLTLLQQLGIGFAGLGVLNSAASGYGQYQSGQETKAAYDYDAAVTLEQMRQKEQTSEAKYSNLIGKQATAYAAAGVDIASGSPLLMMAHTAAQSGAEQASEAEAGDQQAALQRYYGKVAAFQGTVAGVSSFISGLTKAGMSVAGMMGTSSSSGFGGTNSGTYGSL